MVLPSNPAMAYSCGMQHVILSDHREEHLRRLRAEREQRYQQARIEYQQHLRAYDEELTMLAETSKVAFRGLRLLRGAAAWWRHRTLLKHGDPSAPLLDPPPWKNKSSKPEQRRSSGWRQICWQPYRVPRGRS